MGLKVGLVFDGIADYDGVLIFKDIMKSSRHFRIVPSSSPPGSLEGYNTRQAPSNWFDEDGYPKVVPYTPPGWGISIRPVFVIVDRINWYHSGEYTLRFEGKGHLVLTTRNGVYPVTGKGGKTEFRFSLDCDDGYVYVFLDIMSSEPDDHIRNIRVIMPGFEHDELEESPFYPPFLQKMKGFSILRFVGEHYYGAYDVEGPEPKPMVNWLQRKSLNFRSQAKLGSFDQQGCGLSLEHMIKLCNIAGSDLWLCTGHQWNEHYLYRAAELIVKELKKGLKVWVEYSNEPWNDVFHQTFHARTTALKKRFPMDPDINSQQWIIYKSAQAWEIFSRILGSDRVVKVLGGNFEDYALTEKLMYYIGREYCNPKQIKPDVLGLGLFLSGGMVSGAEEVSHIHSRLELEISNMYTQLGQFAELAGKNSLRLGCYAGGLDIKSEGSEGFAKVKLVVSDPYIYEIYMRYMQMLESRGVTVFNHHYVGNWGFHGVRAVLEHMDMQVSNAPRYKALKCFLEDNY